jgi:hypothetical protein
MPNSTRSLSEQIYPCLKFLPRVWDQSYSILHQRHNNKFPRAIPFDFCPIHFNQNQPIHDRTSEQLILNFQQIESWVPKIISYNFFKLIAFQKTRLQKFVKGIFPRTLFR